MALIVGDESASQGMTKAIYDSMRNVLEPIEGMSAADMEPIRESWRKLSYAIANGVIEHIKSNMEIKKIKLIDKVTVNGNTGTASPSNHKHGVDINAENTDLEFTETDYPSGHGHVE